MGRHDSQKDIRHSFGEIWQLLDTFGEQTLETHDGADFVAFSAITGRGSHKGEKVIRTKKGQTEPARIYSCCWGHITNCNRTWIGGYSEALDGWASLNWRDDVGITRRDQRSSYSAVTEAQAAKGRTGTIRTGIAEQIIKESIKRFEAKYSSGDGVYHKCLKDMKQVQLKSITQHDVERIVVPFLYEWGGMGRVLERVKYVGWEKDLTEAISSECNMLKRFRLADLTSTNLIQSRSAIVECYEAMNEVVGRIAAAKVLHLICPDFFPLWDNDIAMAVKSELKSKSALQSGQKILTPQGYYAFMEALQSLYTTYKRAFNRLANQYGKRKLKIIDEFLWWASHRPLGLIIG